MSIPSLMLLKSVQNDKDSITHQQLCQRFCEVVDFQQLQSEFNKLQGDR